MRNKGTKF